MKTNPNIILCACAIVCAVSAHAQIVQSNPLEWANLTEGNTAINNQVKEQTRNQLKIATAQSAIAAEFTYIHDWERKYDSYLQTASGYASSLKASTTLYNDGVRIFMSLGQLYNAVKENPQGVMSTMSLNNLYAETATELASVYTLLKDAIAVGGKTNMLNGSERNQTLWMLEDRLRSFHRKLKKLALSIHYYTIADVWENATAGMIDRDMRSITWSAQNRWRRAAKIALWK